MARTIIAGNDDLVVPDETKRLVEVTRQAFFEGIEFAKVGFRIGDICHAIGSFVKKNGFSVVKDFQGHGVRKKLT